MKYFLILIASLIAFFDSYAQRAGLIMQDPKKFYESDIVILDDIHGVSNLSLCKRAMVDALIDSGKLSDIVLEMGKSAAYLYNEYISTGDSTLLDTCMLFAYGKNSRDFWKALHQYRISGNAVTIHGLDFERMEWVGALKIILSKQNRIKSRLYVFLNSLPDSVMRLNLSADKQRNLSILSEARSIYTQDAGFYNSGDIEPAMIGNILNNRVREDQFGKRFKQMENELLHLYDNQNHKYLLIIGSGHVESSRPVYHKVKRKYNIPDSEICIISLIAKDCFASGYRIGAIKVPINGYRHFVNNATLCNDLFNQYPNTCDYNLVRINDEFLSKYDLNNPYLIDYIVPIDCTYSDKNCGK